MFVYFYYERTYVSVCVCMFMWEYKTQGGGSFTMCVRKYACVMFFFQQHTVAHHQVDTILVVRAGYCYNQRKQPARLFTFCNGMCLCVSCMLLLHYRQATHDCCSRGSWIVSSAEAGAQPGAVNTKQWKLK